MESEIIKQCQWYLCEAAAEKHLVFGGRVFDAPTDLHISDIPDAMQHLDVCGRHIELISLQYIHVTKFELGSCC